MIITLLNRGQREGVTDTPSRQVDDTIQTLRVEFDLHNNELASAKFIRFAVFMSPDDVTWPTMPLYEVTSQGPWPFGRPWLMFDPAPMRGQWVRARITMVEWTNCGVLLYVNEPIPEN